jgi:NADPH:quinone reductase-like Zn-dependent oxidoreductase
VTAAPNAELARELGATGTIDYASEDVAAALRARFPGGIDTLIATHGDLELIGSVARTLRPGGLVVSPAVRPDAAAALLEPLGFTFKGANRLPPARLPELTALLDGGQLRVPPITSFTLEETGAALESMATGHTRGKLVITVA